MAPPARTLATALALLVLGGCKRDDEVKPIPDDSEPEVQTVVLPQLRIDSPARGAFMGSRDVTIQGKVTTGSSPLASLEIDEQDLQWGANGILAAPWTPEPGLNLLGARLEDEDGERAVDGRAFIWGPVHEPAATIAGALRLLLGPDLSELSDLVELVLSDDSLAGEFIGQTITTDYADITPTAMGWSGASVSMSPGDGVLDSTIVLYDVWMEYTADIIGWFEVDGSAWMDSLSIDAVLQISATGGAVQAQTTSISATLTGFGMEVEWVPGWAEDWLADWAADYLASSLEEQVGDMLEELVPEYLAGMAMDFEFGEGVPIAFSLDLDSLEVTTSGIQLQMDAATWSGPAFELPTGAGSIDTEETAAPWSAASGGSFAVLADDDLVNQLLFAFWTSGQLSGLQLGEVELAVMMGEQMDPPLGPVQTLTIDMQLPPIMQPAVQDDMTFNLAFGELIISFERDDGVLHSFSVNASTGATAAMQPVDGEDNVVMSLDGRPAYVQVHVGALEYDQALDPGDLAALIRLMVPPLLSRSAEFMPSVPVPALELSKMTDMEALQGVTLQLSGTEISVTEQGWLLLRGDLSAD